MTKTKQILKAKLESLKDNYNFILIDIPPSLGQGVTTAVLGDYCDKDNTHSDETEGFTRDVLRIDHAEEFTYPIKVLANKNSE